MHVELDSTDQTISVNGVRISLELLAYMGDPDPTTLFRMVKKNDVVMVTEYLSSRGLAPQEA